MSSLDVVNFPSLLRSLRLDDERLRFVQSSRHGDGGKTCDGNHRTQQSRASCGCGAARAIESAKLPRVESRAVAELVFTFFRWRGWLDSAAPMSKQLAAVRELDFQFSSDPESFSTEDLKRAVPDWIGQELEITREWLLSLQTPPTLWLRAKLGTGKQLANNLGDCVRGKDLSAGRTGISW